MPRLIHSVPTYRKHKASGQAIVVLSGKRFYLGPYGTSDSRREYARLIAEWETNHRQSLAQPAAEITVVELLARFLKHAQQHYRSVNGKPTSELAVFAAVMGRLNRFCGKTTAAEFGPLRLKAFRESLVKDNLCRNVANGFTGRVRLIFKWAAGEELIPASVVEALRCVAGLRRGKTEARESEPVKPVPDDHIDAVLPYLNHACRIMVQLQRLTGARSGEICIMRGADINQSGATWIYTPSHHKTAHHGHARKVYLGPRAIELIKPLLKDDPAAYLFSPKQSEAARRRALSEARKTPLSYGNKPGTNKKKKPRRTAGEHYTPGSYAQRLKKAIAKCNEQRQELGEPPIPSWHPHQLRHNAATYFRKEHGLEVARVLLGHRHAAITELYAEVDAERAVGVVAKIG